MKKIFYTLFGLFITSTSYAACPDGQMDTFGTCRITDGLSNWWTDLVLTADNILWYLIWLFYFIAVMVWIYGWFLILVSGWDEEKVKKGKNFVIYMVVWLIIVFLADIIVRWVIDVMTSQAIVWK